jgi:hypothetical protein
MAMLAISVAGVITCAIRVMQSTFVPHPIADPWAREALDGIFFPLEAAGFVSKLMMDRSDPTGDNSTGVPLPDDSDVELLALYIDEHRALLDVAPSRYRLYAHDLKQATAAFDLWAPHAEQIEDKCEVTGAIGTGAVFHCPHAVIPYARRFAEMLNSYNRALKEGPSIHGMDEQTHLHWLAPFGLWLQQHGRTLVEPNPSQWVGETP